MVAVRTLLTFLTLVCLANSPILQAQEKKPTTFISALVAKNYLTGTDLEKLPFATQLVIEEGLKGEKQIKKSELGKHKVKLDSSYEDLKLGLWFAKAEYKMGEPIQALFVLKNEGAGRGLGMWFTLSAQEYTIWNSSNLHIQLVKSLAKPGQKHQEMLSSHIWSCGAPLVNIGRKDFICLRGDLRGRKLLPGVYRLWWNYGRLCSNEVTFTILPERAKNSSTPNIIGTHDHFTWLSLHQLAERKAFQIEGALQRQIEIGSITQQYFEHMARTLAMGAKGRWYPDIYDLPTRDEFLQVSAKFPDAKQDKAEIPRSVAIHLVPAIMGNKLNFGQGQFHLAVIILPKKGATLQKRPGNKPHEPGKQGMDRKSRRLDSALPRQITLHLDLPPNWLENLPFHGPGQCAFILSREPMRDKTGNRLQVLESVAEIGEPRWQGLLRTPWLEITVPPPRDQGSKPGS